MDDQAARILLQSLLERLEADARRDAPLFLGAVSHLERTALSHLLRSDLEALSPAATTHHILNEPKQVSAIGSREPDPVPLSPPVAHGAVALGEPVAERRDEATAVEATANINAVLGVSGPRQETPSLNETALSYGAPQEPDCVLCLDFGTARSKAFAAVIDGEEEVNAQLIELGLGRLDGDADAIYTLASSIWVSDDGLLYVGSEAMRKSSEAVVMGAPRRRLDSIKQQLTLVAYEHNLDARFLEPALNPTQAPLSYEDAICLFLAYLTDLSTTALEMNGKSRYVKRRFTIPSWQPAQRSWAESALAKYVARAQMLADTFHGRWQSGIPIEHWKALVAAARLHDSKLPYLLDTAIGPRGILEPIAAGSGRVWADSATKNLVFVVDVGAGTTDFSLFWVVQNIGKGSPRKAFQVAPYSDAIRMAGDFIDERLLVQLMARAHGSSDELVRKRIETDLRLRGLRSLKERLFTTGEIQVTLVTDQTVSMDLNEFLQNEQVKGVAQEIEKAIARFLNSVRVSWSTVGDGAQIVLTGGGANMPNIKQLADRVWDFAGTRLQFRRAQETPDFIVDNFDLNFQKEYPQLAVAIGGVLPILDEKTRLEDYMGSATPPGPLSSYQVTGV